MAAALAPLLSRLDRHLFDTVTEYAAIHEMLSRTSFADGANDIRKDLTNLNFEMAARKLRELAAKEGWPLEGQAPGSTI